MKASAPPAIFEEPDFNVKMFKLARLAGIDPIQYREKYYNEGIPLLEKYYGMSEDERKVRQDELDGAIRDLNREIYKRM